ncbi:MAG: hypothetical protein H6671_17560 [Anaerolineaceae bacterium]|nr:hypothetical protein [Anaerolineaceae bacterium]
MALAQPDTLFSEIIDFLASTPTPEDIIAFKPSGRLEQRLSDLLERNRRDTLTAEGRAELDEFLRMNHFMNMLKIRAREKLSQA